MPKPVAEFDVVVRVKLESDDDIMDHEAFFEGAEISIEAALTSLEGLRCVHAQIVDYDSVTGGGGSGNDDGGSHDFSRVGDDEEGYAPVSRW